MGKLKLNVLSARNLHISPNTPLKNEARLRAITRIGPSYPFSSKIHIATSNACNFHESEVIEFSEDQIMCFDICLATFPLSTLGSFDIQLSNIADDKMVDNWFDLENEDHEKVGEVHLKIELVGD
ncbi:hypothetical protein CONCODRAFT_70283 [Conidiobolus coronatus NRRL 28638]|uniref:C2 domain-containing protein n=1 Tax=Conidiobolus coronatus (strain ATCC 28846 / CBS 209.66 / NRRL 28638) TaxID=796925 RepID=A0A137P7H6_CONC2|nr:hypothetical protein CONCODRAFT_70283 [Conidiobolus coronatus NRRL 28638]|eukprot:KXN70881.1 hypothetical protein CONCODRAFT_70283 [Conidiobolus coronatus NRRL 28638]